MHMYGFNWHDKHGDTHPNISDEYKFFQQAEERGLLIIHPTGRPPPPLLQCTHRQCMSRKCKSDVLRALYDWCQLNRTQQLAHFVP